jgi:hypothetical protein
MASIALDATGWTHIIEVMIDQRWQIGNTTVLPGMDR